MASQAWASSSCRILGDAQRVEIARDRLTERAGQALPVSVVDRAEAFASRRAAGEHTVASVDNRSDEIALFVDIAYSLLVDNAARLRRQLRPDDRKHPFEFGFLVGRDWRSGIALDTALSEALVEVAAKVTFGQVERHKRIAYLYHDFFISGCHLSVVITVIPASL